jgi:hypothetical protein
VTGVEVHGAEELAALSRRLKAAGDKGLQRELSKGIAKAMEPLKRELPASARSHLPRRGGLGNLVAQSKVRTSRRNSGRAVGLRLQAANPNLQLRKLDDGELKHPVFRRAGRPVVWVTQPVRPGWFTDPTQAAAPVVRAQVQAAMSAVAAQIDGKTPTP